MPLRNTYETIRQAIQDLIAPDLERIKGQLMSRDAKIGAVDVKVDAVRTELRSLEKRLDETLNIREPLAALEATIRQG